MKFSKAQRALVAMPSKWPSILIGVVLSLFISAIVTSNFGMRVIPPMDSISSGGASISPPASPSLWSRSPSSSITAFSAQLFIFLFGNFHSHNASRAQEAIMPTPSIPMHRKDSCAKGTVSTMGREEQSVDLKKVAMQQVSASCKQADAGTSLGRKSSYLHVMPETNKTHAPQATEADPSNNVTRTPDSVGSLTEFRSEEASLRHPIENQVWEHKSNDLPSSSMQESDLRSLVAGPSSQPNLCDFSEGKWVRDDVSPYYNPGSCPFVDEGFSCQSNGRPDVEYMKWRWVPRDCNVLRFNGTDLLERMRGKRIVFVGDSLNRNQWESMLCMLRESIANKDRILQVYGGRITKLPGAYIFKFLDYDCKVEFYTAQYLVDKQDGLNETQFTIRLDRMDKSERRWRKASVLVFNTGHWWTPDKIGEGENLFQEGNVLHQKMNVMEAYGKALGTWSKWVDRYVDPRLTSVFFRGYSPVHYMGGQWNSGGQCQSETQPIFDESFLTPYPEKMQSLERVLQRMNVHVQVLNITRLSDFRKDAHPALYGHGPHEAVQHQDCSHWCLPGLPDIWNELLYFALTRRLTPSMI